MFASQCSGVLSLRESRCHLRDPQASHWPSRDPLNKAWTTRNKSWMCTGRPRCAQWPATGPMHFVDVCRVPFNTAPLLLPNLAPVRRCACLSLSQGPKVSWESARGSIDRFYGLSWAESRAEECTVAHVPRHLLYTHDLVAMHGDLNVLHLGVPHPVRQRRVATEQRHLATAQTNTPSARAGIGVNSTQGRRQVLCVCMCVCVRGPCKHTWGNPATGTLALRALGRSHSQPPNNYRTMLTHCSTNSH